MKLKKLSFLLLWPTLYVLDHIVACSRERQQLRNRVAPSTFRPRHVCTFLFEFSTSYERNYYNLMTKTDSYIILWLYFDQTNHLNKFENWSFDSNQNTFYFDFSISLDCNHYNLIRKTIILWLYFVKWNQQNELKLLRLLQIVSGCARWKRRVENFQKWKNLFATQQQTDKQIHMYLC